MEINLKNNKNIIDNSINFNTILDEKYKDIIEIDQKNTSTHNTTEQKPKKKKKNRCPFDGCKKKLRLLDITCKCQKTFCINHRHPEQHSCDYDFKNEGREKLKKENIIVSGIKIDKI